MAIIEPTPFGEFLGRAPKTFTDPAQRSNIFTRAVEQNAATAAGLVGKVMDGKTDLAIADLNRRSAEVQLQAELEARRKSDRLRLLAGLPALFGGGDGSGGSRRAGDLLAASLQQGFMTPNALLGATNDFLAGMNLFRAQGPEAWTASSRKGTQSILPWLN